MHENQFSSFRNDLNFDKSQILKQSVMGQSVSSALKILSPIPQNYDTASNFTFESNHKESNIKNVKSFAN